MSEPDVTVEVSSADEPDETPDVVDTSDTVVVVSEGDNDDGEIDRWVALEQRLADITSTIESMARDQVQTEVAAIEAANAAEAASEAVAEAQADDFTEDEIIPKTTHRWFRPWREWAGS